MFLVTIVPEWFSGTEPWPRTPGAVRLSCVFRAHVHFFCQEADKEVYKNIDPKSSELYRLANQFRKENADVVGDKPVKNDAGEMSMSDDSKQKAWLAHYQRLLNAEFDWDPNHLSDKWCQLMTPSLALSQVEAQQMQSLSSGSCKKSI